MTCRDMIAYYSDAFLPPIEWGGVKVWQSAPLTCSYYPHDPEIPPSEVMFPPELVEQIERMFRVMLLMEPKWDPDWPRDFWGTP